MKPQGIYVPNITPFDHNGNIMYDSLGELVGFWIEAGVSGIVANASTGEAPYLSRYDKKQVLEYIIEKTDGRCHVFAGTGSMSTHETIELTEDAKECGADAALVTSPFFFKPSDKEIVQHYLALMDAVDLPVILYNVPKFTGYNVNPKVISEISDQCNGLIAIKDSSGNPGNMAEIIRLCGNKLSALSGSADMILPTLMLGGKGAVVAIGNVIPETCVELVKAYRMGDIEKAGEKQHTASYVNKVLVRENPQIAAIKADLNRRGFNAGYPRKPLTELNDETRKTIEKAMRQI